MPWLEDSPLAAGFGAASGLVQGMNEGRAQKQEQARQAELDRQHALAVSVQMQTDQARLTNETQRLGADKIKNKIDFRSAGYDVGGERLPDPYIAPKNHGITPSMREQANQMLAHAASLTKDGQVDLAKPLAAQASATLKAADDQEKAALAFAKAAQSKVESEARIHHWSAQDTERAKHDAATLAVAVHNGQLRFDSAMAGVGARYAAISAESDRANMAHQDRLRGQDLGHQDRVAGNAMRQKSIDALNSRYNAGQQNLSTRESYGIQAGDTTKPLIKIPFAKAGAKASRSGGKPNPKLAKDVSALRAAGYDPLSGKGREALISDGYSDEEIDNSE